MSKLTLRHKGVTLKEYQLGGSRLTIGRHSDNAIQLDDATVSSVHAIVTLSADPYMDGHHNVTLSDFNSTNGVFVNGERVSQRRLSPGDVIRIGQHELLFDTLHPSPFEQTAVLLRDEGE